MTNRRSAWLLVLSLAACGGSGGGSGTGNPIVGDWVISPASKDYGTVAVGQSSDAIVSVTNRQAAPASLTGATFTSGAFSLPFDSFPIPIGLNERVDLVVRYSPLAPTTSTGDLEITTDSGSSPLVVHLVGAGGLAASGSEEVTDFGTQPVLSGLTPLLEVDVPADAISVTFEGRKGPSDVIGLAYLEGPDGHVYENEGGTGTYIWAGGGTGAFATQLPNTDRDIGALVPGGGPYLFRLSASGGGTMNVRAIVERRSSGFEDSVLDLNVWLAQGLLVNAATAEDDTRLQAILLSLDSILQQEGIRLGDVDYYDVEDPKYDFVTDTEFGQMNMLTSAASEVRLNLFFVLQALGNGVVGVSPTVDGPKVNGTPMSGVMSVYDGFSPAMIGLVAAHEIGHFLGLHHTQEEQAGQYDFIDDTLECGSNFPYAPCSQEGGGYLMHWQALGGTDVTPSQGMVIRGHPHVAPDPLGLSKPRFPAPALSATVLAEALTLPPGWCGTCATCRKHSER